LKQAQALVREQQARGIREDVVILIGCGLGKGWDGGS
jgi:hypothetical protein